MTAERDPEHRPDHNGRGFFVDGPQMVNPSDVLAALIADAQGKLAERHYAPDPALQEKAIRREIYQRKERLRRQYPEHGRTEFLRLIAMLTPHRLRSA